MQRGFADRGAESTTRQKCMAVSMRHFSLIMFLQNVSLTGLETSFVSPEKMMCPRKETPSQVPVSFQNQRIIPMSNLA